MKDINNYQQFILEISKNYNLGDKQLTVAALGLAGEAGEVIELIKKFIRDGNIDKIILRKELGDVLAYLSIVSAMFDISMQEVVDANVEKLKNRVQKGTLRGSGNDR